MKKKFSLEYLVKFSLTFVFGVLSLSACVQQEPMTEGFEILNAEQTGIHFSNDLHMTKDMNIFTYLYFFNGAGVGLGDFNNDGWIDIYLVGNMVPDRLYLNKGNFIFEDITEQLNLPHHPEEWSTGVSIVDINQDGLLDLYISQVGDYKTFKGHNKLLLCEGINDQGVPYYREASAEFGLNLVGFGTQALFFDSDLDGDLDLMQLNHSTHGNGTFGQRKIFLDSLHPLAGDRFFIKDGEQYVEKTPEIGIHYNALGYGLGIVASDLTLNGYSDIYVANDFHENDYLYLNQKDGTYKEELTQQIRYTSRFSMGVDAADLNNDAWPDVMTLDMLPYDAEILKKSEGEDALAVFNFKLGYGYNHQYAKNCLQINNGNGTFSEIAQAAGVHATDWSWAVLLFDFDNDGFKDIFISNGIPKRMNDIDYINFVSSEDMSWRIRNDRLENSDLQLLENIPEIKLPNKLFKNNGNLTFGDQEHKIKNNKISYSNGAAYADLNNDGKLDLVVNNINDKAFIYKNISQSSSNRLMISLHLEGPSGNRNAIGAKLIAFLKDGSKLFFEKFPVRGFQSSMETPLYAGLGDTSLIESIVLIWPGGENQKVNLSSLSFHGKVDTLRYHPTQTTYPFSQIVQDKRKIKTVIDITKEVQLDFVHKENPFVEFNREPLIPHMTSSDGPALAIGDLNGDGLDDLFIGASKREKAAVFFQTSRGTFERIISPALEQDSIYEDVEALIIDVNRDGFLDLVVGSGGNEYFNKDKYQLSRVYLNDGKGNLKKNIGALEGIYATTGTLSTSDINQDGYPDLFIGARAEPWAYGQIPTSHLLLNDGTGKFTDVTHNWHPDLAQLGMIKASVWTDWDKDGYEDLLIAVEWGGIYVFYNRGDHFEKEDLVAHKGWWNTLYPFQGSDNENTSLLIGNLGQNSRLKASQDRPVRMYYNDFDDNDTREQILTFYIQDREIVFTNMADITSQIPSLKKKYLYAKDFAKASLKDLVGAEKMKASTQFMADYFDNALLLSEKDKTYSLQSLPGRGQWTSFKTAASVDINNDGRQELLLYGNYYGNNVQLGRYDADFGSLLFLDPDQKIRVEKVKGQPIQGEVRRMLPITIKNRENKPTFVLARNNQSAIVIQLEDENHNSVK